MCSERTYIQNQAKEEADLPGFYRMLASTNIDVDCLTRQRSPAPNPGVDQVVQELPGAGHGAHKWPSVVPTYCHS